MYSQVRILLVGVLMLLASCGDHSAFKGREIDPAYPAPTFSSQNWDGQNFSLVDQRGKVVLLTFGFTFCPDICPFTLRRLSSVLDQLGDRANQVAVVFVSVDPERDTTEKLSNYLPGFNSQIYGLRPDGGAAASLFKNYDIKVAKHIPSGPENPYYVVDHTGDIFVIDTHGQLRLTHPHDTTGEAILADVITLLDQ